MHRLNYITIIQCAARDNIPARQQLPLANIYYTTVTLFTKSPAEDRSARELALTRLSRSVPPAACRAALIRSNACKRNQDDTVT